VAFYWLSIVNIDLPYCYVSYNVDYGKYMDDIVVGDIGDIGDIGQPQCHTCTKKQKNIMKEKEERYL